MHLRGKCGCGNIHFEASGEPLVQLYCHCRSCQTAHAAPLVAVAIFQAENVSYTGDFQKVTVTSREGAARRVVCAKCGTKVLIEPMAHVRAVLPALCETADWFSPQMHIHWQDHTLAMHDELPKFLDVPEKFGGTGKMA